MSGIASHAAKFLHKSSGRVSCAESTLLNLPDRLARAVAGCARVGWDEVLRYYIWFMSSVTRGDTRAIGYKLDRTSNLHSWL